MDEPHSAPPAPTGTALWLLGVVMVVTIGPLIALSQIIAYWRTDVVDDQMFGYYGWRILHGARVYLDVWDNKPPGIYWVNALGMLVGADSYFGIMAMCVVAMIVAHSAFFIIGSSVFQRGAAALATILLSFFLTHIYYTGGTNRCETFLVACELAAVAFYMRGFARDRGWVWLAAGGCCGAAFLFKQVGLAAWGAMGLHTIVLVILRQLPVQTGVRRCLLLLAGAAVPVGLAGAFLVWQGSLYEAWFATFTFNQLYFAKGVSRFPYNYVTWTLLKEHVKPILLLPLLMAVVAVIHSFLWWHRPQFRPPEIEAQLRAQRPVCPLAVFLFATWFLVGLYGALVSPHGFRHYIVPSIPPLLLMSAYLINVLRAEVHLLRRFQQRAWVLVAFVIMGFFGFDAVQRQFEEFSKILNFRIEPWLKMHGYYAANVQGVGAYDWADWELVGEAVARRTGPQDRIECWGYMPGVYLQARRINACRFTTTEKVGQIGPTANFILREIEDTLRAHPPAVITMTAGDALWIRNLRPHAAPSEAKLGPWLDENYQMVEEVARFNVYVYQRNDLVQK